MVTVSKYRLFPLFVLLLSAVLLGVVPGDGEMNLDRTGDSPTIAPQPDPAATVGMTNTMKYTPDTVRIEAGESVRWRNSSLLVHSVTGDPSESTVEGSVRIPESAEPFDSGLMDPEATYTHTFETAGTYQYFCIPHEGARMYGWVIVE